MSELIELSSSGHKLGQMIGDWWEEYIALPTLKNISSMLDLYLDHRFNIGRPCRGNKIQWKDAEGNEVDYDFVMELGGSAEKKGVPVAFIETFWRRLAKHSKDKARDDSGKLLPMKEAYPTARFLGVVAGGDFTGPAREFVLSRGIELFYIPKKKIVDVFRDYSLEVDYEDRLSEAGKALLASNLEKNFINNPALKIKMALSLIDSIGVQSFQSYATKAKAILSAMPTEIRIIESLHSTAVVFENIDEVTAFISNPKFEHKGNDRTYKYEITYSDGGLFERELDSIDQLRQLHEGLQMLSTHMKKINSTDIAFNYDLPNVQ